jgi:hypothetical protein
VGGVEVALNFNAGGDAYVRPLCQGCRVVVERGRVVRGQLGRMPRWAWHEQLALPSPVGLA